MRFHQIYIKMTKTKNKKTVKTSNAKASGYLPPILLAIKGKREGQALPPAAKTKLGLFLRLCLPVASPDPLVIALPRYYPKCHALI